MAAPYQVNLTISAGADFTQQFTALNPDMSPMDITGYTFSANISKNPTAVNATVSTSGARKYSFLPFVGVVVDGVNGIYSISMNAATTAMLDEGKYLYNVVLVNTSGEKTPAVSGVAFVDVAFGAIDSSQLYVPPGAGSNYVLPPATNDSLGGIIVGSGLRITDSGTLSVADIDATVPTATRITQGIVRIGRHLGINDLGFVSANEATNASMGVIVPGVGCRIEAGGVLDIDQYVLPAATKTTLGGVIVGRDLEVNSEGKIDVVDMRYTPEPATASRLGEVKIGSNVSVTLDGTISVAPPYNLPVATDSVLGGVKIGANVSVDLDGKISVAAPYVLPVATDTVLGGIKIGAGLTGDVDGTTRADVESVNNKTGIVDLGAADVDAVSASQGGTFQAGVTAPQFYGALVGNASTATKLATGHNLWGQAYDGSNNVSGGLQGVTSIDNNTDSISIGTINSQQLGFFNSDSTGGAAYRFHKGGTTNVYGAIDVSGLTDKRIYAYPDKSGTVALLTDIVLDPATKTESGVVIVGDNIDVTVDGTISVPEATSTSFGVVQVGQGITVTNGVISQAQVFHFEGTTDATTQQPPASPNLGDTLLNTVAGNITTGWGAISGDAIAQSQLMFYSAGGWVLGAVQDQNSYLPLTGGTLTGPGNLQVDGTLGVTGQSTMSALAISNDTTSAEALKIGGPSLGSDNILLTPGGTISASSSITGHTLVGTDAIYSGSSGGDNKWESDGTLTTAIVNAGNAIASAPRVADSVPLSVYGNSASGNQAINIGHESSSGTRTDYLKISKLGTIQSIGFDLANNTAHGYDLSVTASDGTDNPHLTIQESSSSPATANMLSLFYGSTVTTNIQASGAATFAGELNVGTYDAGGTGANGEHYFGTKLIPEGGVYTQVNGGGDKTQITFDSKWGSSSTIQMTARGDIHFNGDLLKDTGSQAKFRVKNDGQLQMYGPAENSTFADFGITGTGKNSTYFLQCRTGATDFQTGSRVASIDTTGAGLLTSLKISPTDKGPSGKLLFADSSVDSSSVNFLRADSYVLQMQGSLGVSFGGGSYAFRPDATTNTNSGKDVFISCVDYGGSIYSNNISFAVYGSMFDGGLGFFTLGSTSAVINLKGLGEVESSGMFIQSQQKGSAGSDYVKNVEYRTTGATNYTPVDFKNSNLDVTLTIDSETGNISSSTGTLFDFNRQNGGIVKTQQLRTYIGGVIESNDGRFDSSNNESAYGVRISDTEVDVQAAGELTNSSIYRGYWGSSLNFSVEANGDIMSQGDVDVAGTLQAGSLTDGITTLTMTEVLAGGSGGGSVDPDSDLTVNKVTSTTGFFAPQNANIFLGTDFTVEGSVIGGNGVSFMYYDKGDTGAANECIWFNNIDGGIRLGTSTADLQDPKLKLSTDGSIDGVGDFTTSGSVIGNQIIAATTVTGANLVSDNAISAGTDITATGKVTANELVSLTTISSPSGFSGPQTANLMMGDDFTIEGTIFGGNGVGFIYYDRGDTGAANECIWFNNVAGGIRMGTSTADLNDPKINIAVDGVITTVGNITTTGGIDASSASVTNTLTAGNATVNGTLTAGGVSFPTSDGTINQVLITDGAGQLTYNSYTIDSALSAGNSTSQDFNSSGHINTTSYVQAKNFKTTNENVTITDDGNIAANGTITAGSFGDLNADTITSNGNVTISSGLLDVEGTANVHTLNVSTEANFGILQSVALTIKNTEGSDVGNMLKFYSNNVSTNRLIGQFVSDGSYNTSTGSINCGDITNGPGASIGPDGITVINATGSTKVINFGTNESANNGWIESGGNIHAQSYYGNSFNGSSADLAVGGSYKTRVAINVSDGDYWNITGYDTTDSQNPIRTWGIKDTGDATFSGNLTVTGSASFANGNYTIDPQGKLSLTNTSLNLYGTNNSVVLQVGTDATHPNSYFTGAGNLRTNGINVTNDATFGYNLQNKNNDGLLEPCLQIQTSNLAANGIDDDDTSELIQLYYKDNKNFTVTAGGDVSAGSVKLKSPNGTVYKITVDDSGNLTTTAV